MIDRGHDKENNVHVGSEHICHFGMLVTFDTGRYDRCPVACGFVVNTDGEIIEYMTEDEKERYQKTYYMMISTSTVGVMRDPDLIGPMRLLDLLNSIAKRLKVDVTEIRLFHDGTIRKPYPPPPEQE